MSSPWIDSAEFPPHKGSECLPDSVDVIVVGGGLAGIGIAVDLARAGVDVAVLEARSHIGCGWTGRTLGLVSIGLGDHPARLANAMGRAAAVELLRFSKENLDLIAEQPSAVRCGGLWLPGAPGEVTDIEAGLDILQECGAEAEVWSMEQVHEVLGVDGQGPGRFVPGELVCNPVELVLDLARQATEHGASIHVDSCVQEVKDTRSGVRAVIGEHTLDAQTVVFANNASLPLLDHGFTEIITPARRQSVLVGSTPTPLAPALRSQHGHLELRRLPAGGVMATGCRWATPHMEVGETDDSMTVEAIEQRLIEAIDKLVVDPHNSEVIQRWSGIMALTCDGLPLVGPVPGGIRRVVCAGFNGQELGFALRAARTVSTGLLGGITESLPNFFHPARFL